MESNLHKMLKEIGQSKLGYMGLGVVATEVFAGGHVGRLDIVGAKREWLTNFKGSRIVTFGIEVKVSVADLFSHKQKLGDSLEKEKPNFQGVNYQYFLIPKNLLDYERVYDGWGLMIWNGNNIKIEKEPVFRDCDNSEFLFHLSRSKDNWINEYKPSTYKEIISEYETNKNPEKKE